MFLYVQNSKSNWHFNKISMTVTVVVQRTLTVRYTSSLNMWPLTNWTWSFILCLLLLVFSIPSLLLFIFRLLNTEWSSPSTGPRRLNPPIDASVYYEYGIAEMQGKRDYMEDRHGTLGNVAGNGKWSIYGVFDGHGGDGASQYCADHMCSNIQKQIVKKGKDGEVAALTNAFLNTDEDYLQSSPAREDGTTAVVALIQENKITVANAGDSRCILIQASGRAIPLSDDHKPNRVDERERIMKLGGSVLFWGVWRVEGVLAVSRAIGDRLLKPFVIATPEIQTWIRKEKTDRYLLLASDGVWDVLSNEEVAVLAMNVNDPQAVAQLVMEKAYDRGSLDNICVLVIDLTQPSSSSSKAEL